MVFTLIVVMVMMADSVVRIGDSGIGGGYLVW